MKKITSIRILTLFLAFCVLSVQSCFGVEYSDISESEYPDSVEDLTILGIIEGYDDETTFNPEYEMTRGEFCKLAMSLIKIDKYTSHSYFNDVSENDINFSAIMFAAENGYMSGYGDGNFCPDAKIKLEEAFAVMIKMLGFKFKAETKGKFPTGYLAVAKEIGIQDGIDSPLGTFVTRDIATKIIDNSLDAPVAEITGVTDENKIYQINEKNTLLKTYYGCERKTGVVLADEHASIKSCNLSPKNTINIGGEIYQYTGNDISCIVGKKVDILYRIDKETNEKKIIRIREKVNKTLSIDGEDIISFSDGILKYRNINEKEIKVNVSKTADYIVNGQSAKYYSGIFSDISYGTIFLISSDSSSKYDIVQIKKINRNVLSGNFDLDNSIVIDKNNYDEKITADSDSKKISIYNSESKSKITFKDIPKNAVVSISEARDRADIYVSTTKVCGIIESMNETDKEFTISGNVYSLNPFADNSIYTKFHVGDSIKLYLDFNGRGAYVEPEVTVSKNFVYIIKVGKKSIANEEEISAKLLMPDGSISSFKLSETVKINGNVEKNLTITRINNIIGIPDAVTGIYNLNQVAIVNFDENDKISEIRTVREGENHNTISNTFELRERTYVANYSCFDYEMYIAEGAPIFSIPQNPETADENMFEVISDNDFVSLDSYTVSGYSEFADGEMAEAVIVLSMVGSGSVAAKTHICVVKSVADAVSDDGSPVKRIHYYCDNSEQIANYIKSDNLIYSFGEKKLTPADLKAGDVFTFKANNKKEIKSFSVYYLNESNKFIPSGEGIGMADRIIKRNITSLSDKFITISEYGFAPQKYLTSGKYNYTIVRKTKGGYSVMPGTVSEINIGDSVVVQIISRVMTNIIVFKK